MERQHAESARQQGLTEDDEAQRAKRVHQAQKWLAPPKFASELDHAQLLREEGTSSFIFDEPQFDGWRRMKPIKSMNSRRFNDRVLWIHGMQIASTILYHVC